MREVRQSLRRYLADVAGAADLRLNIWWTPQLPIIYVNNAKAACTTVKHNLKWAQAEEYMRKGIVHARSEQADKADDCLRTSGLRIADCHDRLVISCVRNPFARALSGYLDKVAGKAPRTRLGIPSADSFEEHLVNLAKRAPKTINPHFRPQHHNLDFPKVSYNFLFYVEKLSALSRLLRRYCPNFRIESRAPHATKSLAKLHDHYTDRAVELVKDIYSDDFSYFGFSTRLADAAVAPGAFISTRQIISSDEKAHDILSQTENPQSCKAFKSTLRFRRVIELGLL